METSFASRSEMSIEAYGELSAYRHKVFVDLLGWPLECDGARESDQFDSDDTEYVIARDATGAICGCARLLPTTRPYLLEQVFPMLMYGEPVPKEAEVWEVSRFTTWDPTAAQETQDVHELLVRTRELADAVLQRAAQLGAKRLITVSSYGIERLLRRVGVGAHRTGPPMLWDGEPILACWIDVPPEGEAQAPAPFPAFRARKAG